MSETYSFVDIYKKKLDLNKESKVMVDKIVIPKIQRPYAQGREDRVCTYVRDRLLSELFENFKTDEIFDFNFIYGIIRPANDTYVMELLDGQQRLTTLFLLYWYVANRELKKGNEADDEIRNALSRFVYETRSTSTVFCNHMASYRTDLSELPPSAAIRNAKWYFKSFDRDSTISAMLTMLDAIHQRYNSQENHELYKKLGQIRFYIKSLGLFNLSEELYIKMNARGLQLSQFENFKADLINYISKNNNYAPFRAQVPLYRKDSTDEVAFSFNFSVKLDAKWVDLFWKKGSENFDASYMSFFTRFFACKYILGTKDQISDKDIRSDNILKCIYTEAEERMEENEYLGFQVFKQIIDTHPEYILCLDKVLDVFYEHDYKDNRKTIYKSLIPAWDKVTTGDGDDFYANISTKMTQTKLVVLGAVIEFIDAFPAFDESVFREWMRVVWNIVENTNIDSLTPAASLIRKFSALVNHTAPRVVDGQTFYAALATWPEDGNENRAVSEEVEKARRIAEDAAWLEAFKEAELHPFFKGMVLFFYTPKMSLNEFKHRYKLAKNMFDANGIAVEYRKKHLLIRAIISNFNTWSKINELYVTENAERNKYLKNILAAEENVRAMMAKVVDKNDEHEVKQELISVIDNALPFEAWNNASEQDKKYCKMAAKRIRKDIKLYDWISFEEMSIRSVFRIYLYKGHIMFAAPNRQYNKVALDTERAKTASQISTDYGFEFNDVNQRNMYERDGDCFGNDIRLFQERDNCTVSIEFLPYHKLCIRIACGTKEYAEELLEKLAGFDYIDEDTGIEIEQCDLEHFEYKKTYNDLKNVLDEIFDIIPKK